MVEIYRDKPVHNHDRSDPQHQHRQHEPTYDNNRMQPSNSTVDVMMQLTAVDCHGGDDDWRAIKLNTPDQKGYSEPEATETSQLRTARTSKLTARHATTWHSDDERQSSFATKSQLRANHYTTPLYMYHRKMPCQRDILPQSGSARCPWRPHACMSVCVYVCMHVCMFVYLVVVCLSAGLSVCVCV
jgi:hypothetical protein